MTRKRGHPTGEQVPRHDGAPGSSFAPTHGAHAIQRRIASGPLDGRTKIARAMKGVRRALYEHVGGSPTITQVLLIERVVNKLPVLEAMEQYRLLLQVDIDSGNLTPDELLVAYKVFVDTGLDTRYKSFCDSFRADLLALGLSQPDAPATGLADYIKSKD